MSIKPASCDGRVLVVDDEVAVARAIARTLEYAGYIVERAEDGARALALLGDHPFDVVVSDINMPNMSGVELLRAVRGHDLDLPVILLTAAPTLETAAAAVELGALSYLTKPLPMPELLQAVERACQLHRVARLKREALKLLGGRENEAGDRAGLLTTFNRMLETMWIAYQPIVSVASKRLYAQEALLRSREPALPHPGAVLSAAERLGRLTELGQRIRALAAEPFAAQDDETLLFVNLHTQDLDDADLVRPSAALSRIAHRVVFEITERAALSDVKDARARVAELRSMGFRIAIDDLGAGYAGLTSFALLEPEFVKLDMSLVRGVHQSSIKQKLIGSMTALCKDMGMSVVGEGVEEPAERDALISLGCDLLQGYLFAKPGKPFQEVGGF